MTDERAHAFTDDALGAYDAVALAALVRAGEVNPRELAAAAVARHGPCSPRSRPSRRSPHSGNAVRCAAKPERPPEDPS
ncbi:hypothetical protein ACH4E7_32140 [Kitasatospora sp. NPDC018058]|uniref:hypothetical protein n=1 Tax=Kitasatospora sp. NPDC018058 TaxID=3364025 RepID=UPI0037BE3324